MSGLSSFVMSAFGLSGSSNIETLERKGASVKESFLQPQPVGLTNIQCKVIGPHFTRSPVHRHPEVDAKVVLSAVCEAPTDALFTHVPAAAFLQDEAESELVEMHVLLLGSILEEKGGGMPEVPKYEEVLRKTDSILSELDGEQQESVREIFDAAPKMVFLPVTPFGHSMERAISLSCLGLECYSSCVTHALLDCFNDSNSAQLQNALDATGFSKERLLALRPYLGTGLPIPFEALWVMLTLAADLIRRPVVLYSKDNTKTPPLILLPSSHPPQQCSRRPCVLHLEGRTITGAILPTKTEEELWLELGQTVITLPAHATAADYLIVRNDSDSGINYVRLNPPAEEGAETGHTLSSTIDSAPCKAYEGYDPSCLSFQSFPGSYFYVADNKDVGSEMLLSQGYGTDLSGSDEYLERTMKLSGNLAVVHVDSDGHCLVHAISRCLIGKEYLWHALRTQLHLTMKHEKEKYMDWFKKNAALAALTDEYDSLTDRAHPDFTEESRVLTVARGLGTEHLFVLCNILRRPLLLLDAVEATGRESYLFLPILVPPEQCTTKKILIVAWNSAAHQHYVPVVPVLGGTEAYVEEAALPHSMAEGEGASEYLVYACPDDTSPRALVDQYVQFSAQPDGSKRLPVGGEVSLDTRAWCQGVTEQFQATLGYSIWMVHEVSRYLLKADLITAEELGVVKDLSEFERLVSKVVEENELHYCGACTATTNKRVCCYGATTPIDRQTGRVNYGEKDRLPIESVPGYSCCVYKHWFSYGDAPVAIGSPVFARDVGSAFQLGVVEYIDAGANEFAIRFRAGHAAAVRYCCPMEDVHFGFPTDSCPKPIRLGRGSAVTRRSLIFDADCRLRTDPAKLAKDAMKDIQMKLAPHERTAEVIGTLEIQIVTDLKRMMEQSEAKAKRAMAHRGRSLYGQETQMQKELLGTKNEKIFTDKEGRSIVWESMDPRTREWIPYESDHSGTIEAAYQDGQPFQQLSFPGYGVFTVHFSRWAQENSLGLGRPVRRLALKNWNCPNCTLENEGKIERCFLCAGEGISSFRPPGAAEVRSLTSPGSSGLSKQTSPFFDLDDEEEDDAEFYARERTREDKMLTDDRLKAPDGALHKAALERLGADNVEHVIGQTVLFPSSYSGDCFIFWPEKNQWVPIPFQLTPDHFLYTHFKDKVKGVRSLFSGEIFKFYGVRYIRSGENYTQY